MEGKGSEYKRGLWSEEEDNILKNYIKVHGKGKWNRIAKETGLKRCGKSCRLRWMNYLCPNVKRGDFSDEENDLIIRLHKLLGNRWSLIAGRVPGRTDNQVKNHWNTRLSKRLGVNKGVHKICHSSSIISKETGDNVKINSYPKLGLVKNFVGNEVSTSENSNQVRSSMEEVVDAQNLASSDCFENSLWFLNNDPNSYTPISMEFQDEHLDIFLQDL